MNRTVGLIFNEKVAEKWSLWVPCTIHGTHRIDKGAEKSTNYGYYSWTVAVVPQNACATKKKKTQTWNATSESKHIPTLYSHFQNPRNGNWIENQKRGKNLTTFWIIFWIASKLLVVAEDEQSFSAFTVAEDEQSFFFFSLPFGFSFFVCLLIWNMVFWSVCLWSCSEEEEVRVSANFRSGNMMESAF